MNALEDMQLFATTVEAGSFTAAAERLGLSKQFVSRRLAALEARLGVRLLNRTTRRLSVTELGREYHARACTILDAVAETEDMIGSGSRQPRGTLRLAAPMSFGTLHLSPLLPRFLARYPDLRLEIDLNDRTVDLIGEGYDMAIRIGALPDSALVACRLAGMRLVTCCSPGYLHGRGAPPEPEALSAHDCLPYGHTRATEWLYRRAGERIAVPVNGRLRVNNGELARDAALAGLGLTQLPTFIVGAALARGELVTVLDDFAPNPGGIFAVYPQHRQAFLAIRALADFLKEAFGEETWA